MASEAYTLAMLLTLKDAASGGLDRVEGKLKAMGKEGKEALKTFQNLREDLKKGVTIAGVGLAGLKVLKEGVKDAGNFQASMTDLRASFTQLNADGSTNLVGLQNNLNRASVLAMELGNKLPGTTEDFVQLFTVMKQRGIEAETVLTGAGKAAAYLSVTNKALPTEIGVDLATFGQLYQLRGEEYEKAADLFSRIYTAKQISSNELVEASKYFTGRTGSALGITGIKGAEETTRFLAFMRQSAGMEGSQLGTSTSTFFTQLVKHKEDLQAMSKKSGVKLELFDEKGAFKGFDNAFQQFSKLKGKLSHEEIISFGSKVAGDEGKAVFQAMVNKGDQWKPFNEGLNRTIPMMDKANLMAEDFNNKMESLSGTLSNLKVTVFGPMLAPLGWMADKANSIIGFLQEFGQSHPAIAQVATSIFGVASAGLVLYGGVKSLIAVWRLWRIASAIGSNESRVIDFFTGLRKSTDSAGDALTGASGKARGLGGALKSLPTTIKIALVLGAAWYTLEKILEMYQANREALEAEKHLGSEGKEKTKSITRYEEEERKAGRKIEPEFYKLQAGGLMKAIDLEGTLKESLEGKPSWGTSLNNVRGLFTGRDFTPFMSGEYGRGLFDAVEPLRLLRQGQTLRQRAPELGSPGVMTEFLAAFRKRQDISQEGKASFEKIIAAAFPESLKQANQQLSQQSVQLSGSLQQTGKGLDDVTTAAKPLPGALKDSASAAKSFANDVRNIKLPKTLGEESSGESGGSYKEDSQPSVTKPNVKHTAHAVADDYFDAIHNRGAGPQLDQLAGLLKPSTPQLPAPVIRQQAAPISSSNIRTVEPSPDVARLLKPNVTQPQAVKLPAVQVIQVPSREPRVEPLAIEPPELAPQPVTYVASREPRAEPTIVTAPREAERPRLLSPVIHIAPGEPRVEPTTAPSPRVIERAQEPPRIIPAPQRPAVQVIQGPSREPRVEPLIMPGPHLIERAPEPSSVMTAPPTVTPQPIIQVASRESRVEPMIMPAPREAERPREPLSVIPTTAASPLPEITPITPEAAAYTFADSSISSLIRNINITLNVTGDRDAKSLAGEVVAELKEQIAELERTLNDRRHFDRMFDTAKRNDRQRRA